MTDLNSRLATTAVIWNLADLYQGPGDPAIDQDSSWCAEEAEAIRGDGHGRLAELSAAALADLVRRLEDLDCRLAKLATYTFLNFITQVNEAEAGALHQRIRELASRCGTATVFFQLEWNNLADEHAAGLLVQAELGHYRHYLTSMRRYLPHQLLEAEEKILLEKEAVGRRSWNTLFEKIFGELHFGPTGRSEEEVLTDLHHSDRATRRQAAAELTAGLKGQSHILTHIFNTLAADKMITDRLRRHRSWISEMNLNNQLRDETVETLVTAVTSRYDLVQRYYRLKGRILELPDICDYDRYAPLPSLPDQLIDWPTCKNMVLEAFADFSPEMAGIAEQFFTGQWIHAPILPGKRGGAFAHPCVPSVHPYVLVNYTGTLRDVSTVAHELGHGIHQVLAARQGYYSSDTPLVLAETASVFAELLVFTRQVAMIDNAAEKRAFICQKIESIFATVFRQTAMNRFEQQMHNGRRNEGELSTARLSEFWLASQGEMFGDSLHLSEDYGLWWSYIPHFLNSPGYVYSYAFGELLVLALYAVYQRQGAAFVATYLELLAAGGSATPYELLKPFGLDLNDPAFWQEGLAVIEQMLVQIE